MHCLLTLAAPLEEPLPFWKASIYLFSLYFLLAFAGLRSG